MQAEMVSLESLKELPRNPKLHSHGQIDLSMGQFGFLERIVVNRTTGHIISGHGRVETLTLRKSTGEPPPTNVEVRDGSWYVPTDWVEVEESKEEAAAVALNRLVEAGGWDMPLLVDVVQDTLTLPEMTLDTLGFDQPAFDDLAASAGMIELIGEGYGKDDRSGQSPWGRVQSGGIPFRCGDIEGSVSSVVEDALTARLQEAADATGQPLYAVLGGVLEGLLCV